MTNGISIILPAYNEAENLVNLLPRLRQLYPQEEIILVNDGSTDTTSEIGNLYDAVVVTHPTRLGNGAAIKTGARIATGNILVFMDADGQHDPAVISTLLDKINSGYDMCIAARDSTSHASIGRKFANAIYNNLSSWMVNHPIPDLTSGFRAVNANKFREFLYLLPNGFSYPTTITMAFFRSGHSVSYVVFNASSRKGKSHINPIRDGIRFLLIIFRIGVLYSPLKLFLPISVLHAVIGVLYYLYTYYFHHRLSMATVFMLTTAVMIFLIGMVSEQITQLTYRSKNNSD